MYVCACVGGIVVGGDRNPKISIEVFQISYAIALAGQIQGLRKCKLLCSMHKAVFQTQTSCLKYHQIHELKQR